MCHGGAEASTGRVCVQVFGGFTTTEWEVRPEYYGTGESFLFKVHTSKARRL